MNYEMLLTLWEQNRYSEFMRAIDEMNAVDIAEFLSILPLSDAAKAFRLFKKDTASEIFAELDNEVQEAIVQSMKDAEIGRFMDHLAIDDAVDMLEEFPANMVNRVLKSTSPALRQEINRFLNYPEDSVGSIMTSEFVHIRSEMTVSEAVAYIRRTGVDKETVYTIYVTNASKILLGTVSLRDLLFAQNEDKIEELMETAIVRISTKEDKETAAQLISKYGLLVLPVVDSEERLVGIVTVDDAVDVIQEEATEDIEIMAAMAPSDKPYLKVGIFQTFVNRIPWLLFLMISATFTGTIISYYESALGQMVALTAFIPMLMGTGGNASGQASATIIRSLSLGDVRMGNILRVLWKEFRVSLLCGIALSIVVFAKVLFLDGLSPSVAAVVSLTLMATVVVAKLVGCSLPILAKRIKLDPAVMASPFITTIVDAVALLLYFQFASALLGL